MDFTASAGTLYIVSTPIGNMEDISVRALDTLKSVNLILSEDTRETDKLLNRYSIKNSQISYRDQNHQAVYPIIKDMLEKGQKLALVSDSGTPLISDPGYKLIRDLISEGFNVQIIPGPSAVVSALAVSGLPTDKFSFLGFLPKTASHRIKLLKDYGNLDSTVVIYESPFRVHTLLTEILEAVGNRKACIVNDLTKMYEKVDRGTVEELESKYKGKLKGEFVVMFAKETY